MPPRNKAIFILMVAVLVLVGGGAWFSQGQQAELLRSELDRLRSESADMERARAENRVMREKQISPAELATLRADHAAVARLRAEVEALQRSAENRKQALPRGNP